MKLPEELQFIANARLPQKTTDVRIDGRICIITGATSGVGYQAARRLAQGGAHIIMVSRNTLKAEKVKEELQKEFGVLIDTIQADFSKLSEVKRAAQEILEEYPRIDVLINNVGIHNTHRVLNEDGIEMVFVVNHLASYLFTRMLLNRLIDSAPARIIQINSQGHRFGGLDVNDINWEKRRYKGLQGYGASKVAQLLTTWRFAELLQGSGVTINAVHPGEVRSNIGMNNGLIYRMYQRYVLHWVLKDPKVSGEAIYYAAAAPEMAEVSGKYFNQTILEKPAAYTHALDGDMIEEVWRLSEELCGLSEMNVKSK